MENPDSPSVQLYNLAHDYGHNGNMHPGAGMEGM